MGEALKLGLHDARASGADREWLTNVYPFYLHDLSEFDDHYYTLTDRGLWEPDHLPSWLQDDTDHPLIIRQSETRVGSALVNEAPSVMRRGLSSIGFGGGGNRAYWLATPRRSRSGVESSAIEPASRRNRDPVAKSFTRSTPIGERPMPRRDRRPSEGRAEGLPRVLNWPR